MELSCEGMVVEYEIVICKEPKCGNPRVEAINYDGDGECYVAEFMGPDAESRAREYAVWKQEQVSTQPLLR